MDIVSIRHEALRNFAETGRAHRLPADLLGRLLTMLACLNAIKDPNELTLPPNYGAHLLSKDRAGTWLLTPTKNWRMTFGVNAALNIEDLDLEDDHGWPSSFAVRPGAWLKAEIVEPSGLTVTSTAESLGVTRQAMSHLLNGRAGLSADMAIRFEMAFGLKAETLLRMQVAHDLAIARGRQDRIKVDRVTPA